MTNIELLLRRKHDAAMKRADELSRHAVPGTTQVHVCSAHAIKPDPELGALPPEAFIGKFVKITLTSANGRDSEHVWMICLRVEGCEIVGRIDNDLRWLMQFKCGDEVSFSPNRIEEYLDPDLM